MTPHPDARAALDALERFERGEISSSELMAHAQHAVKYALTQMIDGGWKPITFPAPERFDRVCGSYSDSGEWFNDLATTETYIKGCKFTHEFILPPPPQENSHE